MPSKINYGIDNLESWNPIKDKRGAYHCTKISPGCDHCWAEQMNRHRFRGHPYDASKTEFIIDEKVLMKPLHWRKPRTIFVSDLCDLFHEDIALSQITELFDVTSSATLECGKRHEHEDECWTGDSHRYLILTKRPDRMKSIIEDIPNFVGNQYAGDSCIGMAMEFEWPGPNLWLGVTVCNQAEADEKIPILLSIPAVHRWVSIEPMLGEIDPKAMKPLCLPTKNHLTRVNRGDFEGYTKTEIKCRICGEIVHRGSHGNAPGARYDIAIFKKAAHEHCKKHQVDWVVVGSESGPKRRPAKLEWIRGIVEQCKAASVPVFVKQIEINGKLEKDMNKFPSALKIREIPW